MPHGGAPRRHPLASLRSSCPKVSFGESICPKRSFVVRANNLLGQLDRWAMIRDALVADAACEAPLDGIRPGRGARVAAKCCSANRVAPKGCSWCVGATFWGNSTVWAVLRDALVTDAACGRRLTASA